MASVGEDAAWELAEILRPRTDVLLLFPGKVTENLRELSRYGRGRGKNEAWALSWGDDVEERLAVANIAVCTSVLPQLSP